MGLLFSIGRRQCGPAGKTFQKDKSRDNARLLKRKKPQLAASEKRKSRDARGFSSDDD
jgi:hypothetical protein